MPQADAELPDPCAVIPMCPVCRTSPLQHARRMETIDVCLCLRCGTSLSVPHDAWRIWRETTPKRLERFAGSLQGREACHLDFTFFGDPD